MNKSPKEYIALALDNLQEIGQIQRIISQTEQYCGTYKIGLELFTRFGPSILDLVKKAKKNIFLDLKFHDIPNTVSKAVLSASKLGVQFCTIHTQGGKAMMTAAIEALRTGQDKGIATPKLIGVTVLTSIDEPRLRNELNVRMSIIDYICHLAVLGIEAGIDGIVSSASDLPFVKKAIAQSSLSCPSLENNSFEFITPGIRLAGSPLHDQKRTSTPSQAISNGSTLLVIGREVTLANDPARAAHDIVSSLSGMLPLAK